MRRLSSLFTFLFKYVFIIFWCGADILVFYNLYQKPGRDDLLVELTATNTFLSIIVLYFLFGRIKRVHLEGNVLHISNYINSINVDVSDIKSVHGFIFLVWFKLRKRTRFGSTIIFLPKGIGSSTRPLMAELKALAGIDG